MSQICYDFLFITELLRRIALCLHLPFEANDLNFGDVVDADESATDVSLVIAGARQMGILLRECELTSTDVRSLLSEGFPVVILQPESVCWALEGRVGSRITATRIGQEVSHHMLNRRQLEQLLRDDSTYVFVAKKELECDSVSKASASSVPVHTSDVHAEHPSPFTRLVAFMNLEHRDIWTVSLFASVASILALATPLAVESLVNVVSWGTYIQPLLLLAIMLMGCLILAGIFKVLQIILVEIIQRRQFVRIVGDLAHRFPRAQRGALEGHYPREMANRVLEIVTIQKAVAALLLDGLFIVLTTVIGMMLLAFYHPFLLGFDIVLVLCMTLVTWALGRGAVQTAIDESVVKYKIAHWLQDVISFPGAFKVNGGEQLAVDHANHLTTEYLAARQRHFGIVLRQVTFAVGLHVVASTVLLGLGGWLVISQQLTLGQLVASELVVTVVVGAFAKAGKTIEQFYDLLAGIDKIGHLLDIPVDPRYETGRRSEGPAEVRWSDLHFHSPLNPTDSSITAGGIEAGSRTAITGDDSVGKTLFCEALAGLRRPHRGLIEIGHLDAQRAAIAGYGGIIGYAGPAEIFHATIAENVSLGRPTVGQIRVREVLGELGLWDVIEFMPLGLRTMLQSDGFPLSRVQQAQLLIARAMAAQPRLLVIDSLLDDMPNEIRRKVWDALTHRDAAWTLVVVTNHPLITDWCDKRLTIRHG